MDLSTARKLRICRNLDLVFVGALHASDLFMPLRRIALRRQRRADRALLLPLHDCQAVYQQPYADVTIFPTRAVALPDNSAVTFRHYLRRLR